MKTFKVVAVLIVLVFLGITCAKKAEADNTETVRSGKTTILVDETLFPLIQDEVEIFESNNDAKITLLPKSEAEVIQALIKDSSRIAILARKLTTEEFNSFQSKKIKPEQARFAVDAIALITNKNTQDTTVVLQDVISFLQQKPQTNIKGLVFDNPNSSTARHFNALAGITAFPKNGVFSFKTNDEVIKYVSDNNGMIGIVGLNWINNPTPGMKKYLDKINVLSVKEKSSDSFNFPSQNDIAEGKYPLARDLYIVNCQGFVGLGQGFSSFLTGDSGQRIVLKAGLVPVNTPGRKILIRNDIENNKK